MPSLISATERANLTGIFNDIFDTFERRIVVFKEPIKTPRQVNPSEMVYGFGENQGDYGFTYTQVTGVFPAVIRYDEPSLKLEEGSHIQVTEASVSIKVRRDCRDFLNTGPTEKVEFDERVFKLESEEKKQSFLDSEFYVFKLRPVK